MSYANATRLTPRPISTAGLSIAAAALSSPDGTNGNKFLSNGKTALRVQNAGGAPITVTVETPVTVGGLAVSDLTVSVAATTGDVLIGPFGPEFLQPGTQDVFVSFSGTTSVKVDVVKFE